MNRNTLIAAIVIGAISGAWAGVAPLMDLSIWAGFAGITTFFATGQHKFQGLAMTIATTLVGVVAALAMIEGGDLIGAPLGTALAVGAIVVLIVLMGEVKFTSFVPGIFVGTYSTFAIEADWRLLSLSLVAGAFFGMFCDWGAEIAVDIVGTEEPEPELSATT